MKFRCKVISKNYRAVRWFLLSAFLLTTSHDLSAGNAQELAIKWGHPIEVFPVARQIEAPAGHVIVKEPSSKGAVLKRVVTPGLVNVKARMIGDAGVYYVSDWSWKRYSEDGIEPNWITIVGHEVTTEVDRTLADDSGPLIRLRYLTLRHDAVSMLLDGNPDLSAFLGSKGNFVAAENAVFRKLADIAERHSQTYSNEHGEWHYSNPNVDFEMGAGRSLRIITGTSGSLPFEIADPSLSEEARTALNPSRLASSCRLLFMANRRDATDPEQAILRDLEQGVVNADHLIFIGHLKPDSAFPFLQLQPNHSDRAAFYREVAASGAPSDFFELGMYYERCGGSWQIEIQPRLLCLRVLALENVTSRALPIGDFLVEEGNSPALGAALDRADLVSKRRQFLSSGTLKPGEQLIIPLYLTFPAPASQIQVFPWLFDDDESLRILDLDNAEVKSAMRNRNDIEVIDKEWKKNLFRIPKKTFWKSYFENRFQHSGKDYYYGPVALPNDVEIDGKTYSIREFESESLLVAHTTGVGSCPTIYSVNRWDQRERVGHFLTGRDSAENEGFYRIPLKDFGGVLEVVEEDAETSYLKWVRLRSIDSKGVASLLYPSHPVLSDSESGYLKFEQGDRLTVEFRDFDPNGAHKSVWLEGFGYYEPHVRQFTLLPP